MAGQRRSPMTLELRLYQIAIVEALREAFRTGKRAPLLVLATAGGKTYIFCFIALSAAHRGNRVCILVHRQELLLQTSRALETIGVAHGLIAPGFSATDDLVQVASVNATGEHRWCMIPFPVPRPLYGLDRLKGSKLGTVVIVEGEKCADAAQPFFDFPVLSWPGGTNGIGHVDWTPLKGKKPLIWPDADAPGAKAAEGRWNDRRGEVEPGVAQLALAAGAEAVRVIQVPPDMAKGWDVADAIAEGWDKKRLLAFVKANLREPVTPCAPPEAGITTPESPPPPEPPPPTEADEPGVARDLVPGRMPAKRGGKASPPSTVPSAADTLDNAEDDRTPPAINEHFRLVGHEMSSSGGHIFCFLTTGGGRVLRFTAPQLQQKGNLLSLAPLTWWEREFPGTKSNINVDQAANALVQGDYAVKAFNPDNIRGRGAWWDKDAKIAILNLGDHLIAGGKTYDPPKYPSRYIYERIDAFHPPAATPLTHTEARKVLTLCETLSWEQSLSSYLLAGWCVIAPICGALDWRPSVWLLGPSGCGKGWIINHIVKVLVGDWAILAEGDTTAAGLVQTALRSDARPIIFDEAEAENERGIARIRDILFLMRIASSSTGGRQYKGTSDGRGRSTTARTCFLFASINQSMSQMPDMSRVATLGLEKNRSAAEFEVIKAVAAEFCTAEYGSRLLARSISMIPLIRKNAETFAAVLGRKYNRRIGDQLGTLLAGAYALHSDNEITAEGVNTFLADKDWSAQTTIAAEPDEQRMLSHLMETLVRVQSSNRNYDVTMGELLLCAMERGRLTVPSDVALDHVRRNGIKPHLEGFYVSSSNSVLKRIFKGTSWEANWAIPMNRLNGATKPPKAIRFNPASVTRAVWVPLKHIVGEHADVRGMGELGKQMGGEH